MDGCGQAIVDPPLTSRAASFAMPSGMPVGLETLPTPMWICALLPRSSARVDYLLWGMLSERVMSPSPSPMLPLCCTHMPDKRRHGKSDAAGRRPILLWPCHSTT